MKPNPRTLILNLLLAAEGGAMPARDAVAACALFGLRENSVRVALARLAASGLVEAAGRGAYRLGRNAQGLASDVSTGRNAEPRLGAWTGDWIAVHTGALGRSDRVALRNRNRALAMLGLRELERGLFLRPDNLVGGVEGVRTRLLGLGLDSNAAVFVARGFDAPREQRARGLWDGEALDRHYRDTRRRLEDWLAGAGELDTDVAARESFLLGNAAIRSLVFDPLLPPPLIDADARHAFIESVQRFDSAGHAIWRRLRLLPPTAATALRAAADTH
jgi:phenylacetic acid degradation operon negative regulatory protein